MAGGTCCLMLGGERVSAETIAVNALVQDFVADVTLTCTYDNEAISKVLCGLSLMQSQAIFTYPKVINEQKNVIYKCEATVGGRTVVMSHGDLNDIQLTGQGFTSVIDVAPRDNTFQCPLGSVDVSEDISVTLQFVCELSTECQEELVKCHVWMADVIRKDNAEIDFLATITSNTNHLDSYEFPCNSYTCTKVNKFTNKVAYSGTEREAWGDFDLTYRGISQDVPAAAYEAGHTTLDHRQGGIMADDILMMSLTPKLGDSSVGGCGSPGEYIFLIDRSHSMSGNNINHAKQTLLLFLKSLPVNCLFNIIGFGTDYEVVFKNGSQTYNGDTLGLACKHQEKISASMGGTEILGPLKFIYESQAKPGHQRHIFLLTDGKVFNKSNVINFVKKNRDRARVHAFGIGNSVDKDLVKSIARAGGGIHDFVQSTADREMESKVMNAMRNALQVAALNVDITCTAGKTSTMSLISDARTQPVCDGQTLIHYATLRGQTTKQATVTMKYKMGTKDLCQNVYVPLSSEQNLKGLHVIASKVKLDELMAQGADINRIKQISLSANIESTQTFSYCAVTDGSTQSLVTMVPPDSGVGVQANIQPSVQRIVPTHGARIRNVSRPRDVNGTLRTALTKNGINRLARRGGVPRLSVFSHEEVRSCLKDFLQKIIKDTVAYTVHCKRKTVQVADVDSALRNNGITIYGVDPDFGKDDVQPRRVYMRTTPMGNPNHTSPSAVRQSAAAAATSSRPSLSKQATLEVAQIPGLVPAPSKNSSQKRTSKMNSQQKTQSVLSTGSDVSMRSSPSTRSRSSLSAETAALVTRSAHKRNASVTSGEETPVPKALKKAEKKITKKIKVGNNTSFRRGVSMTRCRRRSTLGTGAAKDFTTMINLITLQTFDGSWDLSKNLANIIGKDLAELQRNTPVENLKVWATALSCAWLLAHFAAAQTEWEMIEDKALQWMQTHTTNLSVDDLRKTAAQYV